MQHLQTSDDLRGHKAISPTSVTLLILQDGVLFLLVEIMITINFSNRTQHISVIVLFVQVGSANISIPEIDTIYKK